VFKDTPTAAFDNLRATFTLMMTIRGLVTRCD